MPRNRYLGLFRPVAPAPIVPPSFSITDAQSFLLAVAEATGRHRVSRTYTDETELSTTTEGGATLRVVPAGDEDTLKAQLANLEEAFEREEGRPPTEFDDEFWEAANIVIAAYLRAEGLA